MSGSILPGATIGFLGGGQLGRMTALAARSMGYDVQVLDPESSCATRPVASRTITAPFTDVDAAVDLAKQCDVITLEIEQIHPDVLAAAAEHAPVRPGRDPVYISQDRIRQKEWLSAQRFPLGRFVAATSAESIAEAVREFGPSIAKSTHGGYDGRGQARLSSPEQAAAAWQSLGARPCVVEQRVDIDYEISVMVARRPSGDTAVYPPSRNHHTNGILTWAVAPAVSSEEGSNTGTAISTSTGIRGASLSVDAIVSRDENP